MENADFVVMDNGFRAQNVSILQASQYFLTILHFLNSKSNLLVIRWLHLDMVLSISVG